MCGVTLLIPSPGCSATKSYRQSGECWFKVQDYNAGELFAAHVVEGIDQIDDLAALVREVADQDVILLRGTPSSAARALLAVDPLTLVNRRMLPRKPGDVPHFQDVPRHWAMLDVDNWVIPEGLNIRDTEDHETIVDLLIRDVLPEPFHDVRCYWQWSNSAGQDTRVAKVHLFVWLTDALSSPELRKRMAYHAPKLVDLSPFSGVQPHYVSNPHFEPGARDPMPSRHGWRDGSADAVDLPPAPPRKFVPGTQTNGFTPGGWHDWLADQLGKLGDGDGLEGFHAPITRVVWRYAALVTEGRMKRHDPGLLGILQHAIRTAPRRSDRFAHAVENYASEHALQRDIESALTKVSTTKNKSQD